MASVDKNSGGDRPARLSEPLWRRLWSKLHSRFAAAMSRLGQQAEAKKVFDEFLARQPGYEAGRIVQRLPGTDPRFVEGRDRLVASLRELGLR